MVGSGSTKDLERSCLKTAISLTVAAIIVSGLLVFAVGTLAGRLL
jgi:hypothetical protein